MLSRDQPRQIVRLLRLIAPAADLVDAQIRMGAIGQADSSRSTRYFLDRDHMVEIAEPQPAPFLFDGDAVEAKRAHRGPQLVAREPVVGICFGGERGDLFEIGSASCRASACQYV